MRTVKEKISIIYDFMTRHMLFVTAIITALMGILIYHKFLFGDYVYMANYDSTEQFWQQLSYLKEYILSEGFPGWSFSIGMGAVMEYSNAGDFYYLISILAGKALMPYLFSWLQLSKLILSAVFMFLFLREIGLRKGACAYGGISYAFCAITIIRGYWYHYSSEMVYLALLLYLVERFVRSGKWKGLALLLAMIFAGRGVYFLCLYSLIIFMYVTIRFILLNKGGFKAYFKHIAGCLKVYVTSLLLSGVFWVPSLYSTLTSERVGERTVNHVTVFSMDNLSNIANGILRTFRYDLSGSVDYYHGEYFNSFMFYIGIPAVLFAIFALLYSRGRARKIIVAFLVAALAYICFPTLRYVLNGFIAYEHTKLSNAWVVAGFAACAAYGYQLAVLEKKLSVRALLITAVGIILLVLGCFEISRRTGLESRSDALKYVGIFLAVYVLLLFIITLRKNVKIINLLLVICLCMELTISSYSASDKFMENIHTMKKSEVADEISERTGIFEEIKRMDEDSFYRISGGACYLTPEGYYRYTNPLFGDYFDTSYYTSYVNSYAEFASNVSPSTYTSYSLVQGITENIGLESIIGCKYIITKEGAEAPYGCIYKETYDGFDIYENIYAQDLGIVYDSVISEDMFDGLRERYKALALTSSVLSDELGENYENKDNELNDEFEKTIDQYTENRNFVMTYAGINDGDISGDLNNELTFSTENAGASLAVIISNETEPMNYRLHINIYSDKAANVEIILADGEGGYLSETFSLQQGNNEIDYNTDEQKVQYYMFRFSEAGSYTLSDMEIMQQSYLNERYNELYEELITERLEQSQTFEISEFSQNHIEGSVEAEGTKILLFTIPYDKGWNITVDGEETDIYKVDYGLMAIEITDGYHDIELNWNRPYLNIAIGSTCIGIVLFVVLIVIDCRSKRKAKHV